MEENMVPKQPFMSEFTRDRIFLWFCSLIVVLLFLRDIGNTSMSKGIFLVLTSLVFLLYDIKYSAIFTCFLIPLLVGLPNSYIFIVGLVIFVFKNLNKLSIRKYFWFLVLIFMIEIMSSVYGNFSLGEYLRFIAPVAFISILIFNDRDQLDYKKMSGYFVFGALSAQLSIIFQTISINGLDNLISAGVRLGNTWDILATEGMRISYDPNGFAILCAITISMLLVMMWSTSTNKTLLTLLIVTEIYIGSLSISRAFVVLLAVIVLVFGISWAKSIKGLIQGALITAIIASGVYATVNYLSPSLVESYSNRFAVEDLSAGRLSIAGEYFQALARHPEMLLLGSGLQNYQEKYGMWESSHNGSQEVLLTWGIVGLIIVIIYLFSILRHAWWDVTSDNRRIMYLLPLLVLLVGVQSVQFFSSHQYPMYLLPAYVAMRHAARTPHVGELS